MTCAGCGHENRPGARFCEECAAPLKPLCASCGAELRPSAKFCDACAAPTAVRPAAAAGARKVVTIVFADLVGSTALHERLDAESARRFMESYYRAMRGAVESHGGTVTQLLGDGVKAVFGIPRVAEDDAIRAVRAAVEMQAAFHTLAEQRSDAVGKTGLRVAVNTGEVVANDEAEIIGDPVNVAARLQEQGRDGDVVVGESTQRLVAERVTLEPLGSFALKGRTEAVKAYRVVSLERPAGVAALAFVGRDEELARITAVYEAAIAKPAACLVVLLGSPGLGKSRLIEEFVRRLGDEAAVFSAHCDAAGGASLAPLAVALRQTLGVEASAGGDALRASIDAALPGADADRARIVSGITSLLAGSPASAEETFFVVRRLLASLATTRPVVLVIDDLHWAEPLLLDLVEHLVQWGSGVPLLVLVSARSELRDVRSSLATPGSLVADVITLVGLDAGAAMRLAANVVGAADLPAAVAVKVLAASEGNPLFVGELVRMLVHEGALKKEGERWTTGTALAALEMPPTIQALLAARIERLRPEERSVLERAAVVGRHFSRSAVAELLPHDVTDLDARLESLRRSELIERDTGWFLGEPVLRFHHVLIRDAAYRRVLKETRADLHARLADWIEARAGEATEQDETIGWHLEQAHHHLRELGPIDEKGRALGERAARRLAAAGRRALARDDLPLAASLLGRAVDALDPADRSRADLALDWCEALLAAGDVAPAAAAVDELGRFSSDSARLRAWHTCFAGQLRVLTAPEGLNETADAVSAAAAELTSLGDSAGEAKAHFVYALALARLGKFAGCEAALDRALAAARRADDQRRSNTVLAIAPLAALWGPSPVTRASGRCLDVVRVLRITQSAPAVEAVALSCQGVLEALRGRTDAARRMIASSRKMVEELGITHRLLEADVFAGQIELLEGDAAAAERRLRPAFDGLRELGLGIDAARAGALLARALLALGQATEAEALSHESEALAGDDLKAAIAWRGVRAEALALRGEHVAAVELASQAVEIAAATDALLDHADARLALAAALRAAGRGREADAEERRAIELWQAKGATLLVERASGEVAPAEPATSTPATRASPAPRARPRLQPNAATANAVRLNAAIAARDADAIADLYAESAEIVHHLTGVTYDREGAIRGLRALIHSPDMECRQEPLATLGDSLALCHTSTFASSTVGRDFDVGAVEREQITLIEVDANGRRQHSEVFGIDHLGDAVVRLYERYAEIPPDGTERDRAVATARSVAALLGPPDLWPFAPDAEATDHRTIGFGSLRGADAVLRAIRSLVQLTDDWAFRLDDVLGLRSDALFVRWTTSGIGRASGGAFERLGYMFHVFGSDGLVVRWEQFDVGQEAEALARFDALAAERPAPAPVRRRVRSNAATALWARYDTAFAARDSDAIAALFSDAYEEVSHPTGATWGRDGAVATVYSLWGAQDVEFRHEALATLGEPLGLCRCAFAASGMRGGRFDVAAFERDEIELVEIDEHGRLRCSEIFAAERLGVAIARLYERYAALLSEGPERDRAITTARAVAHMLTTSVDPDPAALFAPGFASVDHRLVGHGSGGREEVQRGQAAWRELADGLRFRVDDVLGLSVDAVLRRTTALGTVRASGGAFERTVFALTVFGSDGKVTRFETFDAGREADALARFDELTVEPSPSIRRRVRPNAATGFTARLGAAIAGQDADALPSLFSHDMGAMDHILYTRWDRHAVTSSWRSLALAEDPTCRYEPLATLGNSLAVCRVSLSAGRLARGSFDVGGYEKTEIQLIEVDAQGRNSWCEIFDVEKLGDAIVRLYERYAELLPQGLARTRAEATSRSVAGTLAQPDLELRVAAFVPDIEWVDHRTVGLGSVHGAEAVLRAFRALRELTETWAMRVEDVLCLRSDAFLVRSTNSGTLRASGGAYERHLLQLEVFGGHGLVERWEQFDAEQHAEALARFDALVGDGAWNFENAATRVQERGAVLWATHDLEGFKALHAPELRFCNRRRLALVELDRDGYFEYLRTFGEMTTSVRELQMLATRGERVALARLRFSVEDVDVGPSEIEWLHLVETNLDGQFLRISRYDLDDLDSAYAELDARFAAGEATVHARASAWVAEFRRSFANRDWDAMADLCAPDQVAQNHRLVGWGTLRGPAAWIPSLQALVELAPDTRLRIDHLRTSRSGFFWTSVWHGTRDGGAFETPWIHVVELDERGRQIRLDVYDIEMLEPALARFEEIRARAAPSAEERFANIATRAWRDDLATFESRDWQRYREIMSERFRFLDRNRLAQLELDRDRHLEYVRALGEMSSVRVATRVLATRGERLALAHLREEVAGGDVGPSEIESLFVIETNDRGEVDLYVRFDADDLDAAYAELDARFEAGEAALHGRVSTTMRAFARGWARRDWEALTALCVSDFVYQDHRLLGFGTSVRGPVEWIRTQEALVDLAPDARGHLHHVRLSDRGYLCELTIYGTREGGAFEKPQITVRETDALGRIKRMDLFDADQLDQARARFAEIGSRSAPDPLRIPPNAATRTWDLLDSYIEAEDWEALRALCAPILYEDRRPLFRLTGDCDVFVANCRHIWELGVHPLRSPLATHGDRLALQRGVWRLTEDGHDSEVETIELVEVDAEGRVTAIVAFGPDDRAAASAELFKRYARSGADGSPAALLEFVRSWNDHDVDRMRAELPADFFIRDHRRTGVGRIEDREAYLASVVALFELSRDVRLETLYLIAAAPHGRVDVQRWFGTNDEGGDFEAVFIRLWLYRGEHPLGIELFEVDDRDAALARFEELRPDPLRIPPNAATRASARAIGAFRTRDWAVYRALAADGFIWEDRGRRALIRGDVEMWISSARFRSDVPGARSELEILGTLGERVMVDLMVWSGGPDRTEFENSHIRVIEVDDTGKLRAMILFDIEDRGAAFAEALARFAAGEAAACTGLEAVAEFFGAFTEHDWDRMREVLPPDFVFDDHRTLGMGTLDREQNIASMRAQADLGPGLAADVRRILAWSRHGLTATIRTHGMVRDGGPFENVFIGVFLVAGERMARYETFNLADLARALARFDAFGLERAAEA